MVFDLLRVDADRLQSVTQRLEQLPLAAVGHRLVKAGVEQDGARRTDHRPYEVVERLQHVMRIAADVVFRGLARSDART